MPSVPNSLTRRDMDSMKRDDILSRAAVREASRQSYPLLPRQDLGDLANAQNFKPTTLSRTRTILTLTHGVAETTLRTSTRTASSAGVRTSNTASTLRPSTTSRPILPPTSTASQSRLTGRLTASVRPSAPPVQSQTRDATNTATQQAPTQVPLTTSILPTTTAAPPPVLVPVPSAEPSPTPGPPRENGAVGALPDQNVAPPAVSAAAAPSMDAGTILGFVLLALVAVALLIAAYLGIRKCISKKSKTDGPSGRAMSINSDSDSGNGPPPPPPMVMAQSFPEIAGQLDLIAYRVANGGRNPPPPPGRELPNAGPVARKFPDIAARLGAIAAQAEKGGREIGTALSPPPPPVLTTRCQPPSVAEELEEQELALRTYQRRAPEQEAMQTTYLVPKGDSSEWVTVSPGIGPSAPGRGAPLNFYTERTSGYYEMDSPVVPTVPRGHVR